MYNLKADDAFQVAMACVTESHGAAKALLHPELLAKFSRDQIDELGATAMANAPLRVNGSKLVTFMSPARFQRALTDEVVPKLLEQHPERLVKAGDILRRLPEEERIRICSTILRERAHADRYFLLRSIGKLSVNETRSISPILLEVDPHACRTFQDKFTFHDKVEAAEWLKKSDLSRGVWWILRSDVFSPDEKLYHFRRGIRAGYYKGFDDLQNVVPRQERDLYISIFKRADSYNGSLCSKSYSADYASLSEVPPEVLEAASALLTRYPEAFYGLSSEKDPSILSQIVKTMPWAEAYQRVEGYQARSARKEFDPWIHEFAPLVAHAIKSGLLDPTKPADGHLLADFIQRVGMINAPLLLEGFVTFKRSKTWDEIPKEQRDAYASFPNFTPELFKSSPSAAVELLLQGHALLRRAILDEAKSPDGTARIADYLRFPYLINSFRSLKGITSFESQADPAEIVQRCIRATRDGRGSESRIVHREIAIMVREREEPSQEAALLQEKKFSELFSKKHVDHAWDTLKSLIREHRVVSDDLTGYVASSIKSLEDELRQKAAGLRQKAEGAKDMVATNLRTHAEQYERGADALEAITLPAFIEGNPEQREAYLQAAIEAVTTSVPFRTEIRDRTLRVLSFDHMYSRGADQLRWKLGQIASADTSLEVLEYAAEFLVNHVHQHYLAHGSRLALRDSGLSDKACSDLRTIWDLTKVSDNPLIKTHRTLLRIANDQQSDREGRTAVTFVPLGAFGRVWSGDFGDACFTRLHQQLADGYFPRVTAYALVTGRNTPNEKINGSVLLIETTTPWSSPIFIESVSFIF
jgi:hypothetical protein